MDFREECLKAHNEYRQRHGVSPLTLDESLCQFAQNWANYLASRNLFQHSNKQGLGENLYCKFSSGCNITVNGREPVESWYNEISSYYFGYDPSNFSAVGHFTQVVWKGTTKLGVAYAQSGSRIVVVANYTPAGNMMGTFAKNVPPVGGFR